MELSKARELSIAVSHLSIEEKIDVLTDVIFVLKQDLWCKGWCEFSDIFAHNYKLQLKQLAHDLDVVCSQGNFEGEDMEATTGKKQNEDWHK